MDGLERPPRQSNAARDRERINAIKVLVEIGERTLTEDRVTIFWKTGSLTYVRKGDGAAKENPTMTLRETSSLHERAFAEKALEAMDAKKREVEEHERRITEALLKGEILD